MSVARCTMNRYRLSALAAVLSLVPVGTLTQRAVAQPARGNERIPEGTQVLRDLAYVPEGHERQKLDLYLPPSEVPLVIWIHGGAWRAGDKSGGPWPPLLERGFAVASVNYRLSRHATFPAQIQDVQAAVRFLRQNAEQWNLDPQRFGAWGASAGGHLAALLAAVDDDDPVTDETASQETSARVQAVCDWFGPTDFLRMNEQAGELGTMNHDAADSPESLLVGGPIRERVAEVARANPITYVTHDDPPFLIVHGEVDPLVAIGQSELLYEALQDAEVKADFLSVPDAGHGRFRDPKVLEQTIKFFERILQDAKAAAGR